jgi:HK97 family phage major capsid protein
MAARIHELRAKWDGLVKEANDALTAAQAKAEEEGRELSAEERSAQDAFDAQITAAKTAYHDEAKKNERLAELGSAGPIPGEIAGADARVVRLRAEDDPRRGFRSHRDFLMSAMENAGYRERAHVEDERLRPLAVLDREDKAAAGGLVYMLPEAFTPRGLLAAAGSDEQGVYDDRYGGYSVPTTTLPGMLSTPFEGDPTAGRTTAVPMVTPSVEIVARTDKTHTTSVSGGLTVTRRPETVAATASRLEIEMITLKAASLFGLSYATEEILQDSALTFVAMIAAGFQDQFGAHMLDEKIRGEGGSEFLGFLNSPAKVQVSKESGQAADTIVANNIIKMAARCWGFGGAIWLANHDTRPQLAVLSIPIGTGGVLLYQPAQQERFPDMLWGRPVFYSEYMPTVGDAGDISLVNFSQYLEGLYQPLQSAESVHVRFVEHERAFKFWLRNAGAPWWRAALTPNKSSDTLSPIVTLAARA